MVSKINKLFDPGSFSLHMSHPLGYHTTSYLGGQTMTAGPSTDQQATRLTELQAKIQELTSLVDLLSRGKYLWETTFDAIQDPVSLIDRQYRVQRANLSMAARAGVDIRQMIGQHCYQVFAHRDSPCEGCPAKAALQRDWQEKANLAHGIRERDYEVLAYPFPGDRGGDTALVMHYRDVTEERRLQQELVQQEKMAAIGMLAGGVAHEINNPLGGILAFTQLLMRDFKMGDPVRGDLEEIERAALRCKKIVQDLLDFSRLSSGREKNAVAVGSLLEKVFGFLRREFLSLNIRLETEFASDLPSIYGDGNRLQQVFLNLLTNAAHAMPRGGVMSVRSRYDANTKQVLLEFSDTGLGIKKEHLSRIFDPFFTTKGPGKGTGLGLSISYRIIREHDGQIQVQSTEGSGTTFRLLLPAVQLMPVQRTGESPA